MVVRELLTTLGFEVDASKLKQYEQAVENVSNDLNKLIKDNTNSAKSFDALDDSTNSLNKELSESVDNLEKVSDITNEATQKTQKLSKSQDDLEKSTNKTTVSLSSLAKGFAIIVTTAAAAAGAAFNFALSAARQSQEISRSARLANTGVEQFQKLAYASESFGIQQDKLADILKDVSDKMGDYAQTGGGAMADFFEFIAPKVGVTADQFRNLSGADALQLYVSSLEKANLSQADMTFYMEAIASDSTLLLPLLEKNGEAYEKLSQRAEEYGLILSEDAIKASEEFASQIGRISGMFKGIRTLLSTKFIPVFSEMIAKVEEFIRANREVLRQNLEGFFDGAIWVVKQFIRVLGTLAGWANKIARVFGGWENSIKILSVSLGVLMALKFIPWVIAATAAIRALNLAMLLNPVVLMTAAIVLLGTAILLLIEDIYHWVAENESAIGDLLGSWENFKNTLKSKINEAVNHVKKKFKEVPKAISDAFESATKSVKNYFKSLHNDVVKIVDKIVGVFTELKDKVTGIFDGVKNNIKQGLKNILPESIASKIEVDENLSEDRAKNSSINETFNNVRNIDNKATNEHFNTTNNYTEQQKQDIYNTNNTNNSEYNNNTNNLTEEQKQEIYNKINLDDSLINSLSPQSETITPSPVSVLGSTNTSSSSVVNDNKTINITVPPGTTIEQMEAIKMEINKTMAQEYTNAYLGMGGD